MWSEIRAASILLVDDDEDNLILLSRELQKVGCERIVCLSDPTRAVETYRVLHPDAVILDIRMTPIDGFEVLAQLQQSVSQDDFVPVIMITGSSTEDVRQRALGAGATDLLERGFEFSELLLRTRNVVRISRLVRQVASQRNWLEQTVAVRTKQLRETQREVVERLAAAAEFRDDATGEHTRRVGMLSSQIAQKLSEAPEFVEAIGAAALLHDIGKIAIPDSILLKPSRLTDQEYALMKTHTEIGAKILDDCKEPVLKMAREIALTHHEHWNGHGYPQGLSGTSIPLSGRIVAVADAFDAITSNRCYQFGKSREEAVAEIVRCSGAQFDPEVVRAFLEVTQPFLAPASLTVKTAIPAQQAVVSAALQGKVSPRKAKLSRAYPPV